MRVLVVGATGLVGHAATRGLLADGHHLVALVRSEERAARVRALQTASVQSVENSRTPILIENTRKGFRPLLHWGLPYWSIIHAEDAGAAITLALGAAPGTVCNVVDVALLGSSLRVSNALLSDRLGFRPIFPSCREIFTETLAHGG